MLTLSGGFSVKKGWETSFVSIVIMKPLHQAPPENDQRC